MLKSFHYLALDVWWLPRTFLTQAATNTRDIMSNISRAHGEGGFAQSLTLLHGAPLLNTSFIAMNSDTPFMIVVWDSLSSA